MIRDGKLSLRRFWSQLQTKAIEHGVKKFHLPLNSEIFKYCTIENFKKEGQQILTNCSIILTNAVRRVTSDEEKVELLNKFHSDKLIGGHCGRNKLYAKLRSKYYWKGMSKDISKLVKTCRDCQLNKPNKHTREEMKITPTPQGAFDIVIIDTIGPITKSERGNTYAVTIICDLTKHLTIVPIANKEAHTVARAIFENFILTFSVMKSIRTDLGTEYRNQILNKLSEFLDFKHNFTTAYHHQSVGTVERNHRVLNAYLRTFLVGTRDDWDVYARYFEFCYNTTPSVTGYTPFELVFGKQANLPIDKLKEVEPIYNLDDYVKELKLKLQLTHRAARDILTKYKEQTKTYYYRKTNAIEIKVGDSVKIKNDAVHKLERAFRGPFKVTQINDKNVHFIDDKGKIDIVHKNRVIKYHE